MKVSIAWIFDHINADYHSINIEQLVEKFNETTAEIEGWYKVTTDLTNLAFAKIQSKNNSILGTIPEWSSKADLENREGIQEGGWYLVYKEGKKIRWATSKDLGGHKEMLLPAIAISETQAKGSWKKEFEKEDYILEVDNKSITHRPDLWGHRGFAREIAVILGKTLKDFDSFISKKKIEAFDKKTAANKTFPFSLEIEDPKQTKRFAGYYISKITNTPSLLWMLTRLSRIDARSIDAIIDCTNYVMFDISQPMHAFDADKLASKSIKARQAQNKESLMLLDNSKIELTSHDIVIADGAHPISLAGIMGGKSSAVTVSTTSLFLESANFNPTTIRRSSGQHKIRSEASARFEKTLDPNQNVDAIFRFLKLLDDNAMSYEHTENIVSLGKLEQAPEIEVSHTFIEKRLGVSIAPEFIVTILRALGFGVKEIRGNGLSFKITVPLFRASKDIAQKEDIVEEIGRFYGYGSIPFVLPTVQTRPTNQNAVTRVYDMKHFLAYGLSMHEIYSYAFFDESFLREIAWDPGATEAVKDPVSGNWFRLATTLIPHMFKAVVMNMHEQEKLNFFEWGRTWEKKEATTEKKGLTGIFFDKKKPITFYDAKAHIQKFFSMLDMTITWQSMQKKNYPWFDDAQTAHLFHEGNCVGTAGMVSASFMNKLSEGSAFVFELDGDYLEKYQTPTKKFVPLSKYPLVERDISIMVPLAISVAEMSELIKNSDSHIVSVQLKDFFHKKEWKDEKSLTFRYIIKEETKTMTKAEVDSIVGNVEKAVQKAGASIR